MRTANSNMNVRISSLLSLCILLLLFAGCAGKRWSSPLLEDESIEIVQAITAMQEKNISCQQSLDADALIFWKTPVAESAITGYLQLQSPSKSKFIVSNPLGMIVYAIASDGKTFQILDTSSRQHTRGNIRNLVIRKGIPLALAQVDWFAILTGHLPVHTKDFKKISRDTTNQSIWVLLPQTQKSLTAYEQWVNIDLSQKILLGYLFLDENGNTIAEISYEDQGIESDGCHPKNKVTHISELPWGTEIKIELRDIRTDTQWDSSNFSLPVPKGYFRQLQP